VDTMEGLRDDSPVECWREEELGEPEPFGLNGVNRRLLSSPPAVLAKDANAEDANAD